MLIVDTVMNLEIEAISVEYALVSNDSSWSL